MSATAIDGIVTVDVIGNVEHVVAGAAAQGVVVSDPAVHRVATTATQQQLMGACAAVDFITTVAAHHGVVRAGAAEQRIVAIAASQQLIVAAAADNKIVAVAAVDRVIRAAATVQRVTAAAANNELVVAVACVDGVVSRAAIAAVGRATGDRVVAASAMTMSSPLVSLISILSLPPPATIMTSSAPHGEIGVGRNALTMTLRRSRSHRVRCGREVKHLSSWIEVNAVIVPEPSPSDRRDDAHDRRHPSHTMAVAVTMVVVIAVLNAPLQIVDNGRSGLIDIRRSDSGRPGYHTLPLLPIVVRFDFEATQPCEFDSHCVCELGRDAALESIEDDCNPAYLRVVELCHLKRSTKAIEFTHIR